MAIALFKKWDAHHTLFWDGGHIKFWSRATLSKLLEEEGFEVIGFHGCGRAPYLWVSMIIVGQKNNDIKLRLKDHALPNFRLCH